MLVLIKSFASGVLSRQSVNPTHPVMPSHPSANRIYTCEKWESNLKLDQSERCFWSETLRLATSFSTLMLCLNIYLQGGHPPLALFTCGNYLFGYIVIYLWSTVRLNLIKICCRRKKIFPRFGKLTICERCGTCGSPLSLHTIVKLKRETPLSFNEGSTSPFQFL